MIKMEETGPEGAKRQRLNGDTNNGGNAVRRMHHHRPESTVPLPLHTAQQAQALNPPSSYQQRVPHSPFVPQEGSTLPEQQPNGGYSHPPMDHNPPARDSRPLVEQASAYGRPNITTPLRSPENGHSLRPIATSFPPGEPSHYQQHQPQEVAEPQPGYVSHDGPPNGVVHGLTLGHPSHEMAHGQPPPGAVSYADQELIHGQMAQSHYQPPYSATPTSATWPHRPGYPPSNPPKRSARAQQACDNCRTRKAKCDEGKPTCSYCKETGQTCVYKEVQPAKADRAQKEIMDQLREAGTELKINKEQISTLQETVNGMEDRLRSSIEETILKCLKPGISLPLDSTSQHQSKDETKPDRDQLQSTPQHPQATSQHVPSTYQPRQSTPDRRESYSADEQMGDRDDEPAHGEHYPRDAEAGEEPVQSIAVDHSTGVHRLLRWPIINDLLQRDEVRLRLPGGKKLEENFVMQHETSKGQLRVYGRGQGRDDYDGASTGTPGSPATSTTSTSKSDDSRSPAASPPVWGAMLGPPHIQPDGTFFNNTTDDHPGGFNMDGSLKVDRVTMDTLLKSYLDNIHILHPFLDRKRLKNMFDKFYVQSHPNDQNGFLRSPQSLISSIINPDGIVRPSRKRKLSNGDSPRESTHSDASRAWSESLLDRRAATAIVLLVMALGKICLHKEFLPGPAPDIARENRSGLPISSPFTNSHDSPNYKNSPSRIGSPYTLASDNRSSSFTTRATSEPHYIENILRDAPTNVDVIPGLAYYAKATEILGPLHGGNDLVYVQVNLLASLYMGQLACSLQSWSWIQEACRSCIFLMRSMPFKSLSHDRVQLIRFAYWTCFQFEGDILAELDLKPSGIEDVLEGAESVKYPGSIEDTVNADNRGKDTKGNAAIIFHYSSQISMRTTLNKIQKFLYPPDSQTELSYPVLLDSRNKCFESLSLWRSYLPSDLRWSHKDPPAADILNARLRAKFWGTMYIITRPLLNYALHHVKESNLSPADLAASDLGDKDPLDAANHQRIDVTEVLRTCRMCIFVAKQSTIAFDTLVFESEKPVNRLIVTNIFGTAHAQFGNMLVLSAIYLSQLHSLIDRNELLSLLQRTITFLMRLTPISNTLGTDANILRGVWEVISQHRDTSSASFSSNHS